MSEKVYKLYHDDKIFFELFKAYYENDFTDLAINILSEKADCMPHDEIFNIIKDKEKLSEKHLNAFSKIFQKIEKMK